VSSEVKIKGLSELNKFLQTMPVKMEANVIRAALRVGAKVIKEAAERNVPVSPPSRKNAAQYNAYAGALRDSLRYGARVNLRKGKVIAYVRAGGKSKKNPNPVFWAKWAEYGTKAHDNGNWMHPGADPSPYMRPALNAESQHALLVIANFIKMRLDTTHGLDVKDIGIGGE